jgi:hypothetical protein
MKKGMTKSEIAGLCLLSAIAWYGCGEGVLDPQDLPGQPLVSITAEGYQPASLARMQAASATNPAELLKDCENLVLSRLSAARQRLIFSGCPPGTYEILSENNYELIGSASIAAGDTVSFALAQDRYVVRRVDRTAAFLSRADLSWNQACRLTGEDFKPFPVDVLLKKGSTPLYRRHTVSWVGTISPPPGIQGDASYAAGVLYRLDLFSSALTMQLGYASDEYLNSATGAQVVRESILSRIGYEQVLINRARLQVYGGVHLGHFLLHQQIRRPREREIRSLGYPAIPMYQGSVWEAGPDVTVQIPLPLSLVVEISGSPAAGWWTDTDGMLKGGFLPFLRGGGGVRF